MNQNRSGCCPSAQALLFVATRIQNEQQPVVAAALNAVAMLHPRQVTFEHTDVLEKLAEDADAAPDASAYSSPSMPVARLAASIGCWRLRYLPCQELESDGLLRWAVNFGIT